ncbi:MAG: hypothetical protein RL220_1955 [Bacteroidota bacterium]
MILCQVPETFSQTQIPDQDTIPRRIELRELVITGTKTFKRKTESPVIVNILDSKTLSTLQVCNLSESLKFQPGLRIEANCQTCQYTQLRMNGLQGGYSQILINGRPIFSPLMGLYGMDQLPVNMIEKIEVVRGGGSSLYGSSAIGGTVNVITKIPLTDGYEFNSFYQSIGQRTDDFNLGGNATLVNKSATAGTTIFMNKRNRKMYDANGDRFSEIPSIDNLSFGVNSYYRFTPDQKLEVSLSNLNEYRYGGEMTDQPAHLAMQSEERDHRIWMASADYQINFNEDNTTLIGYAAFQDTYRSHYTGIFPESEEDIQSHLETPPYGTSQNNTYHAGMQLNHRPVKWFKAQNVLTAGTEIVSDEIDDRIPAYNYLIDQRTIDWGSFFQSDWKLTDNFNLLSGVRVDLHNLLDKPVFSPRIALLYSVKSRTQFRLNFGTGFRAPQAFDSDLHIAFAGGGVSRVRLSPDLSEERSRSFSASVNHDSATERYIAGFTLEAFYTHLDDAFVLQHTGEDEFGEVFEKRNGSGATVSGATIELRGNFRKKIQLEGGFTMQTSLFDQALSYIEGTEATREFLRTPNEYGFANLSIMPDERWNFNLNLVYTGPMLLAHFGGAENFLSDAMTQSPSFTEINLRISRSFRITEQGAILELYTGVKNLSDAYQSDFDKGPFRDSNYIYGPIMPRTLFLGVRLRSAS